MNEQFLKIQLLDIMEHPTPDPSVLYEIITTKMPYGKYKGHLISDIPESYLLWCNHKDAFPNGKIGDLMRNVLEIKINGLDYILLELKKMV